MSLPRLPRILASALLVTAAAACADGVDGPAVAHDNDPPLADRDELLAGAPKADELPSEWKADGILPKTFDLSATQSPVQSQARRGVCSIFSTVGLMEHLYIAEGTIKEPDFSEQYLQWSTKNEVGAFPGTSGSSAGVNLQAINQFGIPDESAWRYEPEQWSSANDPECTGEDPMPNKCYTNGEPPAEAVAAVKFKLPRSRFISTRDIKMNIFNKKQGVIADMDFFYQAWNHRKSTLPITAENWNDGIVMFPNDDDRRISLEERAGHSIVLIGWDDEMEVPVRDKDGNTVKTNGAPVTEKGFYLFKNSWGTVGFGIENPFGPGYGWISQRYIHEIASIRAADLPTVTKPTEACGDGSDNDGDMKVDCDDSDCAAAAECSGGTELSFDGPASQAIPDNSPDGVAADLVVPATGTIGSLTVKLAIKHSFRGDLVVSLAHGGKTVKLHDRSGGGADDLTLEVIPADWNGMDIKGEWRLLVVDTADEDVGTIQSWSLTALVKQ